MPVAPRLILTGFMGTGKSAVGREVARRLNWRLVDCDAEIAARAGKPVAAIFRDEGEARFRTLERGVIAELTADQRRCPQCGARRPAVIATGGGTLVDERNYAALAAAGVIVCLQARAEVIAARIGRKAAVRPKLVEGAKPVAVRVAELLEERRAAYARADWSLDTSDLSVEQAAERVLATFASLGRQGRWAASV